MSRSRPPRDCRAARERMALHYYGTLSSAESAALRRHLESCAACANEWDAVRGTLDALDPATVFPGEAEVDWGKFARHTVARALAAAAEGRRAGHAPAPGGLFRPWPALLRTAARWTALAATLAVVAVVLHAWLRPGGLRPMRSPAPESPNGGAPPLTSLLESAHVIEGRLARQGAARYLNDSRALLVNLIGATARCRRSDDQYDISLEREKSRQLLRRKNLYEGYLLALQDQRLATLVRQLESVLIQVTALNDCAPARQIHDLREQIEKRQILLRIDLVTREMAGRADVV